MFDDLTPPLWLHVMSAIVALVLGAMILAGRKGTPAHRIAGIGYMIAMLITVASAAVVPASVVPLFGRFGIFHIFVALGAVSLVLGVSTLLRWRRTRDPEALRGHQIHLAYSYVGLVMAGVSQVAVNPRFALVAQMTPTAYWTTFAAVNLLIYVAAVIVITRKLTKGDPLRFRFIRRGL